MTPRDILDIVLKLEIDKINENLPQKRISIEELLKKEPYSLPTKKSEKILISKKELSSFIDNFDESLYKDIRIPLIFLNVKDIYKTAGAKIDQWVAEKLLGYEKENVVFLTHYEAKHSYYYGYQVRKLKRKYPNIIQMIYSL
ncbi:MAG: hypothetical protein HeimC3_17530 [Candidatus Heimdallarchaeota archaeon LC_3]|nr:MAG: hypothetical protein HeimC3_17530 [Candidatus Heimdallarchaeota archaeon LC_3]